MWSRWLIAAVLACAVGWLIGTAHAGNPTAGADGMSAVRPVPMAPIMLLRADVLHSDAIQEPGAQAAWQSVDLPHRAVVPMDAGPSTYWYRTTFSLSGAGADLWLLFPMLRAGGKIFLNGAQIDEIEGSDLQRQMRWFEPFMLFVPPALLRAGENRLSVRVVTREPLTSFGEFWIGPQAPLRDKFERLRFWESTMMTIASIVSLLTASLMFAFWWRRRQETAYALFGMSALLWGMRSVLIPLNAVPMQLWVGWRFLYYLSTGGFVAWLTIFLLAFSGAPMPRLRRFLLANWLVGAIAFLIIGTPLRAAMDKVWVISFIPFMFFAVSKLAMFAWRERTVANFALVAAMLWTLALGLHDYAAHQGFMGMEERYLLHLGIPAFLIVMAAVLLERFVDSLAQAESSNEHLAQRIAERETALIRNHEQLRTLERAAAASEERQRIMQDMHDGVGSQLMSTLILMQRGPVSQPKVISLLQECLDDMRLVIDSLVSDDPDLLGALGHFRFRMEARFSQMGIAFRWHNICMPETCNVAPHASLQVLRILQEALTNVLKHASAQSVDVTVTFARDSLTIAVRDDGRGMRKADEGPAANFSGVGRGLINMAQRAARIGGVMAILAVDSGFAIALTIPLMRATEDALAY
jgi:signal transduction histidine kinase